MERTAPSDSRTVAHSTEDSCRAAISESSKRKRRRRVYGNSRRSIGGRDGVGTDRRRKAFRREQDRSLRITREAAILQKFETSSRDRSVWRYADADADEERKPLSTEEAAWRECPTALSVLLKLRQEGAYSTTSFALGKTWNCKRQRGLGGAPLSVVDTNTGCATFHNRFIRASSDGSCVNVLDEWLPHAHRCIPFSTLETPPSDAVLALDRYGSYILAVGTVAAELPTSEALSSMQTSRVDSNNERLPCTLIKFYAVPSPSRLLQTRRKSTREGVKLHVSVPLHVIPLILQPRRSHRGRDNSHSNDRHSLEFFGGENVEVPVASTQVRILVTSDSSLGVAFLLKLPSPLNADTCLSQDVCEALGSIVIFQPPPPTKTFSDRSVVRSYHCTNVPLGGWTKCTMANLLWPTQSFPVVDINEEHIGAEGRSNDIVTPFRFYQLRSMSPAKWYLFCNDENDGYRLTWVGFVPIREGCVTNSPHVAPVPVVDRKKRYKAQFLKRPDVEDWEQVHSKTQTGGYWKAKETAQCSNEATIVGPRIVSTLYLQVDVVLNDIFMRHQDRRRNDVPTHDETDIKPNHLPDFAYSLVSVSKDGTIVTFAIVFVDSVVSDDAGCSALLVGTIIELDLVVQSYDEIQWVRRSCRLRPGETFLRASVLQRRSDELAVQWRRQEVVVSGMVDDERANDGTAMGNFSMLYPFCDVITNEAVTSARPVSKLACRGAPITLTYG